MEGIMAYIVWFLMTVLSAHIGPVCVLITIAVLNPSQS